MSRRRTNSSWRPEKKNTSLGLSWLMKVSSTWPNTAPRTNRTVIAGAAVIVPMLKRCSLAKVVLLMR